MCIKWSLKQKSLVRLTYLSPTVCCLFTHQVSDSFETLLWFVVCKDPPPIEFPRQKYWSRLPFPSSEDLPGLGIKSKSPTLQAVYLLLSHHGLGDLPHALNLTDEIKCTLTPVLGITRICVSSVSISDRNIQYYYPSRAFNMLARCPVAPSGI